MLERKEVDKEDKFTEVLEKFKEALNDRKSLTVSAFEEYSPLLDLDERILKDSIDTHNAWIIHRKKLTGSREILSEDKIGKSDYEKLITDEILSRCVRNVTVYVPLQFSNDMKMVIYDVPGFDSPTTIHRKQTLDKLFEADLIIFLNPLDRRVDFKASVTEMLRAYKADNARNVDISLAEKTLMFGNKIDGLENPGFLDEKIEISVTDGKTYLGEEFSEKQVIPGCARARWHEDASVRKSANEKLKISNHTDGFEKLYDSITNFFRTQCFSLLSRKIRRHNDTIIKIAHLIISDRNHEMLLKDDYNPESILRMQKDQDRREMEKRIKIHIKNSLKSLLESKERESKNKKIEQNFLKKLKESFLVNIDGQYLERLYSSRAMTQFSLAQQPSDYNIDIRKKLHAIGRKQFQRIIYDHYRNFSISYNSVLRDCVESALTKEDGSGNITLISQDLDDLLNRLMLYTNIGGKEGDALFKRFCSDVIDILLSHPLGSPDRLNNIKAAIVKMSILISNFTVKDSDLLAALLAGRSVSPRVFTLYIYESIAGENIQAKELIEKILGDRIEKTHDKHTVSAMSPKPSTSNEDVLKEILGDIDLLKKTVLEETCIPLIAMDNVFYNMFNEQVNGITEALVDASDNSKVFNDFWIDIYDKLYGAKYKNHEVELALCKEKREALLGLQELVNGNPITEQR